MTEYKPKLRKKGLVPPWGYYQSPDDPDIMIPDKRKLEALEHSFRMRSKYRTTVRDCCLWLYANTGEFITAPGYWYLYKRWLKSIRQNNGKRLAAFTRKKFTEKQKYIEEKFGGFTINIDDEQSIHALADRQAEDKFKEVKAAG